MSQHGLSDDDLNFIRTWTPLEEDLDGQNDQIRAVFQQVRLGFAMGDFARTAHWAESESVESHLDIPYLPDGKREHLLDLYLPHDAVLRAGHTTPVYIDIHGGGFTYGWKELNRNFCLRLAEQGFAVFSLNYPLMPAASFVEQLTAVNAALTWIREHLPEYPVSTENIFLTGDSAGGTLSFYTLALTLNPGFAETLGLVPSGLPFKGAALVSGLFDVAPLMEESGESVASFINMVSGSFFDETFRALPTKYRVMEEMVRELTFPPLYLCTSSDDFIEAETLAFATQLSRAGKPFILDDWAPVPGQSLGHVFPVCTTWLPESVTVLEKIREFSYGQLHRWPGY